MLKAHLFPASLCIAVFCLQSCRPQPPASADLPSRIRQVEENLVGAIRIEGQGTWKLEDRMSYYKVPGVSIAVINDFKLEWAKGYGWADTRDKRKVNTETLFQAASISKSLNGVGLLKLAQGGKVDLNTDINSYLTSWKFPYDSVSKSKKITISNLLSHTAGLSVHGFRGYAQDEPLPTVLQILDGKAPANSDPVRSRFEPGIRPEYSGGGTTITQLIVTDITHRPYDEFMDATVLKPMGMENSFFTQPPPEGKRGALATAYREGGSEVIGKFHIYPEQAPAGLWTNPTDLSKYIIETQLSLEGKSSKVLSQAFTKTRLTPFLDKVALGVFISDIGGEKYFEHSGGNEGFRCVYMGSMTGGRGVVVMVNSDNGMILQEIVNSVFAAYGWEGLEPVTKKIVKLTPEQWKSLDGLYEREGDKNVHLQFTSRGDKLILRQDWDGREITFEAESDVEFFCRDFPFPLKFTRNAEGKATKVLAFGRDVWIKVKE
ncbi:MAG: serine hydrolase domain-containing protein [Chryseolinea sp.]